MNAPSLMPVRKTLAIRKADIPRLAALLKVTPEYLVEYHLAHGGRIDDFGGLVCSYWDDGTA